MAKVTNSCLVIGGTGAQGVPVVKGLTNPFFLFESLVNKFNQRW